MFPLTQTPLTQQNIDTLKESLEKDTHIEVVERYPHEHKVGYTSNDPTLIRLQNKISYLTEKLKYMHVGQPLRPQVWCINFHVEGHHATKCETLIGPRPYFMPMGPIPPFLTTGVVKVGTNYLYQGHTKFHAFPNLEGTSTIEYCEIFHTYGHSPCIFHILKKH